MPTKNESAAQVDNEQTDTDTAKIFYPDKGDDETSKENDDDSTEKDSEVKSKEDDADKDDDSSDDKSKDVDSKDGDKEDGESKDGDKDVKSKDGDKEDGDKEDGDYELILPEKSLMTDEHYDSFIEFAEENDFTQEQAQKLLERENSAIDSYVAEVEVKKDNIIEGWIQESKKDSEIGGEKLAKSAEYSRRVIETFGREEAKDIKDALIKTGWGNNPIVLKLFSRIGEAMGDDSLIEGGKDLGGKERTTAEIFYGSKK